MTTYSYREFKSQNICYITPDDTIYNAKDLLLRYDGIVCEHRTLKTLCKESQLRINYPTKISRHWKSSNIRSGSDMIKDIICGLYNTCILQCTICRKLKNEHLRENNIYCLRMEEGFKPFYFCSNHLDVAKVIFDRLYPVGSIFTLPDEMLKKDVIVSHTGEKKIATLRYLHTIIIKGTTIKNIIGICDKSNNGIEEFSFDETFIRDNKIDLSIFRQASDNVREAFYKDIEVVKQYENVVLNDNPRLLNRVIDKLKIIYFV